MQVARFYISDRQGEKLKFFLSFFLFLKKSFIDRKSGELFDTQLGKKERKKKKEFRLDCSSCVQHPHEKMRKIKLNNTFIIMTMWRNVISHPDWNHQARLGGSLESGIRQQQQGQRKGPSINGSNRVGISSQELLLFRRPFDGILVCAAF